MCFSHFHTPRWAVVKDGGLNPVEYEVALVVVVAAGEYEVRFGQLVVVDEPRLQSDENPPHNGGNEFHHAKNLAWRGRLGS